MAVEIFTVRNAHPPQGYSHAARHENTIYVAGQVAYDRQGTLVGRDDIERQTRQAFANLELVLVEVGSGLESLLKLTVYLTRREDIVAFRAVRDAVLSEPLPPSTLLLVQALASSDLLVEIDAIAAARR